MPDKQDFEDHDELFDEIGVEDDDDFEYESMEVPSVKQSETSPVQYVHHANSNTEKMIWNEKLIYLLDEISYSSLCHGTAWNSFDFSSVLVNLIRLMFSPSYFSRFETHFSVFEKMIYFSIQLFSDKLLYDTNIAKVLVQLLRSDFLIPITNDHSDDSKIQATIYQYQKIFSVQILSALCDYHFFQLASKHYPNYIIIRRMDYTINQSIEKEFSVTSLFNLVIDFLPLVEDRISIFVEHLNQNKKEKRIQFPIGSLIEFQSISIILHFVCICDQLQLHLNEKDFVFQRLLQSNIISTFITFFTLIQTQYQKENQKNIIASDEEKSIFERIKDELELLLIFLLISERLFPPFITKVKSVMEIIVSPNFREFSYFNRVVITFLLADNYPSANDSLTIVEDSLKAIADHLYNEQSNCSLQFLSNLERLLSYFIVIQQFKLGQASFLSLKRLMQMLSNQLFAIPSLSEGGVIHDKQTEELLRQKLVTPEENADIPSLKNTRKVHKRRLKAIFQCRKLIKQITIAITMDNAKTD